jgi:hypothetical protein
MPDGRFQLIYLTYPHTRWDCHATIIRRADELDESKYLAIAPFARRYS